MKKEFYSALFLFVFTLLNCHSQGERTQITPSNLNKEQLEFARDLSEKILQKQKDGGYYILTETEATSAMVAGLNETVQKEAYKKVRSIYGDYKGVKFVTLVRRTEGADLNIYRFKGLFETNADVEVRTVLNADGKLAGFFIKPWNEKL